MTSVCWCQWDYWPSACSFFSLSELETDLKVFKETILEILDEEELIEELCLSKWTDPQVLYVYCETRYFWKSVLCLRRTWIVIRLFTSKTKKRKKKTSLFSLSLNACQWLSTILEKSSSSIVPNSSWHCRPVHLVHGMAEEEKADLVFQYKWTSSGRAVFDFTNKTKGRCLKLEQVRHLFFGDECSEHLACSLLLINRTCMKEASGRSWWLCKCT